MRDFFYIMPLVILTRLDFIRVEHSAYPSVLMDHPFLHHGLCMGSKDQGTAHDIISSCHVICIAVITRKLSPLQSPPFQNPSSTHMSRALARFQQAFPIRHRSALIVRLREAAIFLKNAHERLASTPKNMKI